MKKGKLLLLFGLTGLLTFGLVSKANTPLSPVGAEDSEYVYYTNFEGITINANVPPDGVTGFIWAQDYLNAKTVVHENSTMLYVTATGTPAEGYTPIGGFGTGSKSNLARCVRGESYIVETYLEFHDMEYVEVECVCGSHYWGAAKLYPDGTVLNDNGANNMVDVFYDGRNLSFVFTYEFNVNEGVNGYITFKAFHSNNGYAYLDNCGIKHSDKAVYGTFEEYPLGEFDANNSAGYKTFIYTETNDLTSTSEIIKENNNQKLKLSFDSIKTDYQSMFYFNKMQFLNIGREYLLTFDMSCENIDNIDFIYGGTWIEPVNKILLDYHSGNVSTLGTVFEDASFDIANQKMNIKFVVPDFKEDSYQILVVVNAKENAKAVMYVDNFSMKQTPVVNAISVDVSEAKTSYGFNEDLDVEGLKVFAHLTDGSAYIVNNDECSFAGYDKTKIGKQTITVTYKGVSTSYQIVLARIPSALNVNTANVKLNYTKGEKLDLSGLVVTVSYQDGGADQEISHDALKGGYAIFAGNFDSYKQGTYKIIIIYKDLFATFNVNVSFEVNYDFGDITSESVGE